MFTTDTLIAILRTIRNKNPLIHNITNQVVTQFTANMLLCLGASPAMVNAEEEVGEFVQKANALVINIGTLSSSQAQAMILASHTAHQTNIPWVLDPVGINASTFRAQMALKLLQNSPTAIRGNASEIINLYQFNHTQRPKVTGHGVDSIDRSENALQAAKKLALLHKTIVSISGQIDYITDGKDIIAVKNGQPLLTKITGSGCAATAITAACLAVEQNSLYACAAAMAFIGIACDIAMRYTKAPGTLQISLLDELYLLNDQKITEYAKIKYVENT